jgi:ribose/xylose/arabinose/galactoside ABC-type transport system permease subunit
MSALLLSLHVVAAIVAIGPICVAASMFPAEARRALDREDGGDAASRLRVLARICRVYAAVGIAVPVLGLMTGSAMGVLTEVWVIVSIVLTLAAFVVLAAVVLPRQQALLAEIGTGGADAGRRTVARLAAATGVFNLLWVTVTVLMIVRPGSTTGV